MKGLLAGIILGVIGLVPVAVVCIFFPSAPPAAKFPYDTRWSLVKDMKEYEHRVILDRETHSMWLLVDKKDWKDSMVKSYTVGLQRAYKIAWDEVRRLEKEVKGLDVNHPLVYQYDEARRVAMKLQTLLDAVE